MRINLITKLKKSAFFCFQCCTHNCLLSQTAACADAVKSQAAFFKGISVQRIIYPISPPLILHESSALKHTQMLRYCGLRYPQCFCQRFNTHGLLFKEFYDLDSPINREDFE